MSGVKTIELDESEARRREEMRRQAEQRERQRREEAHKALNATIESVLSLAEGLTAKGSGNLARIASERASARLSLSATVKEMQEAQIGNQQIIAVLTRCDALLRSIPEGQPSVQAAIERSFKTAGDITHVVAVLQKWETAQKSFAQIERSLRTADQALRFLEACEIANVSTNDVASAAAQLKSFIYSPSAAGTSKVVRFADECTAVHFQQKLQMRRDDLLDAIDILDTPLWKTRLAEWRTDLANSLPQLRNLAERGDWNALAEPLAEVDSFLKARGQHRLEILEEGAQAAGFKTLHRHFDDHEKSWTVDMHDTTGFFGPIVVGGASWTRLAEESIRMLGPAEFDSSACMHGGVETMIEQLRAQGVKIRLFSDTQLELVPPKTESAKVKLAESRKSSETSESS